MINVGVIGLGMGQAHLKAYSEIPDVRILGIADLDQERLDSCAAQYDVPKAYTGYRQLLAEEGLDAVSICVPNYLHAPFTIDALRAGKHVLVEKPMAKSAAEAEAMLAAAQETGKTLAVSMNYRWIMGKELRYLKHLVSRGGLGEIYYVRAHSLRLHTGIGAEKTWFVTKHLSGGAALIDMGPHILDLAMWLAGDFAPVSASGVTRTAIMVDTDVDDFATALVRMKGGATIALESTWASYTRPGLTLTLFGTQGGAILDMSAPPERRLTLFGQQEDTYTEAVPLTIQLPQPQEASVQEHFINCLREGQQPENSAERGLAVMRVLEAVYRSSASGREVTI